MFKQAGWLFGQAGTFAPRLPRRLSERVLRIIIIIIIIIIVRRTSVINIIIIIIIVIIIIIAIVIAIIIITIMIRVTIIVITITITITITTSGSSACRPALARPRRDLCRKVAVQRAPSPEMGDPKRASEKRSLLD